MLPTQEAIDCPNQYCAVPAALEVCARFANGFGLQLGPQGPTGSRWDDVHCLVCGHFSSPYAKTRHEGRDLRDNAEWLAAVDRALMQAKRGRLSTYLDTHQLGLIDLLTMRQGVQRLRDLLAMTPAAPTFPHVGLLRLPAAKEMPDTFGVAHGEAESEPFARKVRVLGRLIGADALESAPRHCTPSEHQSGWFFYEGTAFIGLLCLQPNRNYRGTLTIDGCLDRLLHAS